jgi:lipoprotein-releasing system ATP-binding protein
LLKVENISKEYPSPRGTLRILSDISLTLSRGEAISIMGPSGSGKSTLLYILGALEPPTSGTVTLDGNDPFKLNARQLAAFRNKEIGFIFQDHCLLPQCSVIENVLTPTLVAENHDNADDRAAELIRTGWFARTNRSPARRTVGR